ncbi:MAG: peptidase inhibitor I78 [Comamonadaceae bacterium]|nr:MAG: peptidase inhibitor I78 [Comamonadaceae bacterium]
MFSLASTALIAACAAPTPAPAPPLAVAPAAPPKTRDAQCNAEAAKFTVGQPFTPQLEAAARARAGAITSRMLKPHQVTTMEFNEGRLNIDVDARNRVTSVRCG